MTCVTHDSDLLAPLGVVDCSWMQNGLSTTNPGLLFEAEAFPWPLACRRVRHVPPAFSPLHTRPILTAKSEIPGLVWGEAHKLVPVAFGVKKLVLSCVVEDDKVRFLWRGDKGWGGPGVS